MSTSDWMPKYFYDTKEFSELREVYSEHIDTTLEACLAILRSSTNPTKWSDDTINEFMAICGVWQIYTYDREQKENAIREFLSNKNLMTDKRFVNIVKEMMDGSEFTLDINRHHNISVVLNSSIEDVGTDKITYNGCQTSKYAAIERSIQNNFPAGVRLIMNCNLTDYHKNSVTCACDMAILFESETNTIGIEIVTLYRGEQESTVQYDFTKNKYYMDGIWVSPSGVRNMGYTPYKTKFVYYYSAFDWDLAVDAGFWDDTNGTFYVGEETGTWWQIGPMASDLHIIPKESVVTLYNIDPSHTPKTIQAIKQHRTPDDVLYFDELSRSWKREQDLESAGWILASTEAYHYGIMSNAGDNGGKFIESGTVSGYALAYTASLIPTPQPEFGTMSTHNDTIVVDLNDEWAVVDPNSPNLDEYDLIALRDFAVGHTIFKSVSNKGIQGSVATAYIRTDFLYDDSQKIYTMNCAESGSDYIEMKSGDVIVFQDTSYTGEFTEQEFEIPSGEREFIVTFTKDSSVGEFGDCAYFAMQTNKISSVINAAPLPEPGPVYTPKYVRLSFGAARNNVTIKAGGRSSVALKFYYGGTQYDDIGGYLTGDGSPLNFSIAMAKTKTGANIDTSNLVVHGDSDADLNLYVYNNGSSEVTLATVWIKIPRYTYAVYDRGWTLNDTISLSASYVNLIGANPTWNYTPLPNALYKLMGVPGNLFDAEFRNSDGTYSERSDLKILIGNSFMNVQSITGQMLYNIPSCRFETWLPEMYNLIDGEMVLNSASALSLEEE